ncbi:MAG: type II toxin-antitoxin system VapC family toxin [Candidatus Helarchaeota archaeon]
MTKRICLDTGIITLYYQEKTPDNVNEIIRTIRNKKAEGIVPNVIIVEAYKHLCVLNGKEHAENCIRSFLYYIKPQTIPLSIEIIFNAGSLKCKYRNKLSYNDSILLATALNLKAEIHTTEKDLPKIQHLKFVTYDF